MKDKEILKETYYEPDEISDILKSKLILIVARDTKNPRTFHDYINDKLCFLVAESEEAEEWICLSDKCLEFFNDEMENVVRQSIIERLMAGVYEEKL